MTVADDTLVTSGNVDGRVMDVDRCAGGADGPAKKENIAVCTRRPFGWSVRAGKFSGGRYADVVAGFGAGELVILRGGPKGIAKSRVRRFTLPGIAGTSAPANDYAGAPSRRSSGSRIAESPRPQLSRYRLI